METEGRLYYSVKQFPQKLSLGGSKEQNKQINKTNKTKLFSPNFKFLFPL